MALQSATFLRGKMGNVVFVERYGNYYARSQPLMVRQSVPTKIRSSNFATANNFCKYLRPLLRPMLPFAETKLMKGRLSGAFTKWFKLAEISNLLSVDSIPFVNGFNYNALTSIAERWKIKPVISISNEMAFQLLKSSHLAAAIAKIFIRNGIDHQAQGSSPVSPCY